MNFRAYQDKFARCDFVNFVEILAPHWTTGLLIFLNNGQIGIYVLGKKKKIIIVMFNE